MRSVLERGACEELEELHALGGKKAVEEWLERTKPPRLRVVEACLSQWQGDEFFWHDE